MGTGGKALTGAERRWQEYTSGLPLACPACGAEPGQACDRSRIPAYEGMHFARRKAGGDGRAMCEACSAGGCGRASCRPGSGCECPCGTPEHGAPLAVARG